MILPIAELVWYRWPKDKFNRNKQDICTYSSREDEIPPVSKESLAAIIAEINGAPFVPAKNRHDKSSRLVSTMLFTTPVLPYYISSDAV